jgi:small subunit ribosomal protein S20
MANTTSADKANRQMIKHRTRNRSVMSNLRTAVKAARTAVDGKQADAAALVKAAISTIDKAVSKGVLKRETAARYVSRLAVRKAPSV